MCFHCLKVVITWNCGVLVVSMLGSRLRGLGLKVPNRAEICFVISVLSLPLSNSPMICKHVTIHWPMWPYTDWEDWLPHLIICWSFENEVTNTSYPWMPQGYRKGPLFFFFWYYVDILNFSPLCCTTSYNTLSLAIQDFIIIIIWLLLLFIFVCQRYF